MNINNIKNLLKVYFYENWKNDVIYNFVIMMVLSFMFLVMSAWPYENSGIYVAAVVLMLYYPCRIFSKLHQATKRIHYLTIPASNGEKVVTGMFLANIYYVLGIMISITIGLVIGYFVMIISHPDSFAGFGIHNLGEFMMAYSPLLFFKTESFPESLLMLYAGIAIMFFAAIYFKKSPFWKLLLTGFIILVVVGIIMLGTEWLNVVMTVPAEIRSGNYVKIEEHFSDSSNWFQYVAYCATIVYFYAMSFLRMRETEA